MFKYTLDASGAGRDEKEDKEDKGARGTKELILVKTDKKSKKHKRQERTTESLRAPVLFRVMPPLAPLPAPDLQFSRRDFVLNRYTSERGEPKMLQLFCMRCTSYVMTYQKDGPGRLLRTYYDRIVHPVELNEFKDDKFDLKTADNLDCKQCEATLGVPMIYAPEKRPAIRIFMERSYFNQLRLG
jgi:hypothetical protein